MNLELLKGFRSYLARFFNSRTSMPEAEPIEISSSDSSFNFLEESDNDSGLDDITETGALSRGESTSGRILPTWASTSSGNRGNGGQFPKVPSPRRTYASGSSAGINDRRKEKIGAYSGYSDDARPSNGNGDHPQVVKSQIATLSGGDYEKLSSRQALKMTLPSTFRNFGSSAKSYKPVDDVGSSNKIRDNYNASYSASGPSLPSGRSNMREHITRGGDGDVIMYDNNGGRILPPTLVPAKSMSTSPFIGDPIHRSGFGEEMAAGTDERLIYQAALEDLNQPKKEEDLPYGILSVSLLKHQRIALNWMLQKETRSVHCLGGILADDQGLGKTVSMIALIQMQRSLESKSKSEHLCNPKTEALNLDEDDDNNGTAGSDKINLTVESNDVKPILEGSTSIRSSSKRRPAAGTLVVCPASVLRQWRRELEEKVTEEARLSVLVYHGGSRTRDPVELAKYDVVLTTYSIVTNEVPKQPLVDEDDGEERNGEKHGLSSDFSISKKRKKTNESSKKGKKGKRNGLDSAAFDSDCGALARVGWFRVILDEAQTIKNHRTQVARACCSLRAKRRWCLSGTPIQNAIEDLYSYFRFLKYDPYAVYKSFYHTIKVPISRNSLHGYKKLQAVLRAIMLRRTKGTLLDGQPIIQLPEKKSQLKNVEFSTEERAFYTQIEADTRAQFKAYAAAGTVSQNYANILMLLLRLRQACDHPYLVKGYNADSVGKSSAIMARNIPKDEQIKLLNCLETTSAFCRVCSDTAEDPVVTMCGHVFCYQCVSECLTGDDNTCPAIECKEQLRANLVFSVATLQTSINGDGRSENSESVKKPKVVQMDYNSSKIKALLKVLQGDCCIKSTNPDLVCYSRPDGSSGNASALNSKEPSKAIVFSQWTGMLDLVEMAFNQSCMQYRRLDGTMSLAARDRAVKDFNTDPEVMVMLMSLKAGNLGLNMVAACHVILLDLWWNPTTEDQAVDRAHRIGQTRDVTVTRITIANSVEDRILLLQEDKRKMVASAFGEDQGGGTGARLTVEDLKYLFMV